MRKSQLNDDFQSNSYPVDMQNTDVKKERLSRKLNSLGTPPGIDVVVKYLQRQQL